MTFHQIIISRFVYHSFPELATRQLAVNEQPEVRNHTASTASFGWLCERLDLGYVLRDFMEFQRLPVFYCSLFSTLKHQ
jgi:hypothetical protein